MGSRDLEPVAGAMGDAGGYIVRGGVTVKLEGPTTGLPWGVEQVRLNCLSSAENFDRIRASYLGSSEFGVGLAQGTADGYRRAAEDLIRYAWWRP